MTEIKQNLPKELNFKLEGQNIEKFAAMFKHLKFVKVLANECMHMVYLRNNI